MSLSRFVRRDPDCAYRVIDREALVVKVSGDDGSRVFTLNRAGTVIWELADGAHTVSDMEAAVQTRFEIEDGAAVRRDIEEFIGELERRGIALISCYSSEERTTT